MTASTYDELAVVVVALQARIAGQDAEIAELRRQLAASWRNSATPPSTGGLGRLAPKVGAGSVGAQAWRQPGYAGRPLGQVDKPDEVVVHEPGGGTGCGAELPAGRSAAVTRRQVCDLPKITVRVVAPRLVCRRCRCGPRTTAAGPAGVSAPVPDRPPAAAVAV